MSEVTYQYCSKCNKDRACVRRTEGPNSEIYYRGRVIKCSAGQKWKDSPGKKQRRCDGYRHNNKCEIVEPKDIYPELYMHGCDILCKACENFEAWVDMQEWKDQQQFTSN